MAKSDPRKQPRPLADVPALVHEGAALWNDARYWDAHEAWEDGWHALRAAGRAEEASFLQGLILATAGWENLRRGKPEGFRRQVAHGLLKLRRHRGSGAALGLRDERDFVDALTDRYLDVARRSGLASLADGDVPPRLDVAEPRRNA